MSEKPPSEAGLGCAVVSVALWLGIVMFVISFLIGNVRSDLANLSNSINALSERIK